MARRCALTPELAESLGRSLREGASVTETARDATVPRRTLTRWLERGLVERPVRLRSLPPPVAEAPLVLSETALVGVVLRAAGEGNWRAASWLLSRAYPARWGRPTHDRVVVVEPPPADVDDPFSEIDQLAEARRRRERLRPGLE